MSLREVFSKNLEKLCATQKSHAHVARELGVNRQQFSSYIKGKNLPNEGVIDKICDYFQVDLGTLFRETDPVSEFKGIDALINKHKNQLNRVVADEISSRDRGLADGLYYVYFAIPNDPDSFSCSLLAIRREGGLTTFRRISRPVSALVVLRSRTQGIHNGIVMLREGTLFFIGVGKVQYGMPSMLVANTVISQEFPYSGEAIVHAGAAFQILKFCISPVSKRVTVWKAMRRVRLLNRSEIFEISPRLLSFFDGKRV